jgi:hypothetical protein
MNAKQNLLNGMAIATVLQSNPQAETIAFLNQSLNSVFIVMCPSPIGRSPAGSITCNISRKYFSLM